MTNLSLIQYYRDKVVDSGRMTIDGIESVGKEDARGPYQTSEIGAEQN